MIETGSVFKGLIRAVSSSSPHSQSEREEFETDYKQKYERERVLLMEEHKKLSSELDNVSILPVLCLPETRTYLISLLTHQARIIQV